MKMVVIKMMSMVMMMATKDEISVRRFTWALVGVGGRGDAQSSFC